MSSKINLQTCEYARKSSIFQDNQLILHKNVKFRFPATKWIILPCCGMILGCGCGLFTYRILCEIKTGGYVALFGGVLVAGGVFLLAMRLCSKKSTN